MAAAAAAGIIAGSSLIGGILQGNAARDAANTQAAAADEASKNQLNMYNQTRKDQEPWRQAGVGALQQLQDPSFQKNFTMADFQQDPGYAFRMSEGQKAIERSAAARGGLTGGATLKALDRFSQGTASDEYQNAYSRFNQDSTQRFNRLASIAGVGQTATNATDQAGQNTATNIGNNITGAANAQAAGTIGQANATAGMIGNGANTWMQYQMMNRITPATGSGYGAGVGSTGNGYGDYSAFV